MSSMSGSARWCSMSSSPRSQPSSPGRFRRSRPSLLLDLDVALLRALRAHLSVLPRHPRCVLLKPGCPRPQEVVEDRVEGESMLRIVRLVTVASALAMTTGALAQSPDFSVLEPSQNAANAAPGARTLPARIVPVPQ